MSALLFNLNIGIQCKLPALMPMRYKLLHIYYNSYYNMSMPNIYWAHTIKTESLTQALFFFLILQTGNGKADKVIYITMMLTRSNC